MITVIVSYSSQGLRQYQKKRERMRYKHWEGGLNIVIFAPLIIYMYIKKKSEIHRHTNQK